MYQPPLWGPLWVPHELSEPFNNEPICDFRIIRELQRGQTHAYEKHKYKETANASLELHPGATLLNVGAHHWLVLKIFRHSLVFGDKNQFVDRKDKGNSATCFAYGSASMLKALWRLNLGVRMLVKVVELTNCHPNSQDDRGCSFAKDCLCYIMAYGVDTVPMQNGSLEIDKHNRHHIDGYMKVSHFYLQYLILAVTQQQVIASMMVGEKFSNSYGPHGDDIYEERLPM